MKTITIPTNRHGQTIEDLRAKYWPTGDIGLIKRNTLGRGVRLKPLVVVNPLALAVARVNFDSAQALRNRVRMWHASPEVKRDTLRLAHEKMQQANENLAAAYGF